MTLGNALKLKCQGKETLDNGKKQMEWNWKGNIMFTHLPFTNLYKRKITLLGGNWRGREGRWRRGGGTRWFQYSAPQ